jgi:hypothetical protein
MAAGLRGEFDFVGFDLAHFKVSARVRIPGKSPRFGLTNS